MSSRKWVTIILVNIVVSAVVVIGILWFLEGRSGQENEAVTVPATITRTAQQAVATDPVSGETITIDPLATSVPTAEPTEEAVTYIIQSGDTLGAISTRFDVPLEDIKIANGITNENLIQVGQLIVIPVNGLPTPTPIPTSTPIPTWTPPPTVTPQPDRPALPTATPDFVAGAVNVTIVDVVGLGVLTEEAVFVVNSGNQPVNLSGWTLLDVAGNSYTFGAITLFGDGAGIRVHTEAGQDQFTDLYWGLEQAIWLPGKTVILRDPSGEVRSQFLIP